jgi:hypothetical protein
VDDDALTRFLFLFLMPVTLSEQYWVTLAERRSSRQAKAPVLPLLDWRS